MRPSEYLKQAKLKAAAYCAKGEKAPYQVMQKLLGWKLNEEEARQVLAELTDKNFINEERFSRAYCRDKLRFNQWGKQRIRQELNRLKISEKAIEEGLMHIEPGFYNNVAIKLAAKKWNSIKGDSRSRKQKTIFYLVQKGFEMDLSKEVTGHLSAREQ